MFTASEQCFKGGAITLRQIEVVENSLKENSVFIVPEDQQLVNLISGIAGAGTVMIPMGKKTNTGEEQSKESAAKSRK
ncbi:MAG: hypothetical protein HYU39_07545 [Thaumarchaeota archaeon]|nr:hypothetical protein [Nitrososphaerota archaeon]